ncbi:hypothetical protein LY78DRAFT_472143 [Colletotrichum sublineola]|nr:hypothetical protein LY78DRAFT_472143 [Colletotrichum sublineola]
MYSFLPESRVHAGTYQCLHHTDAVTRRVIRGPPPRFSPPNLPMIDQYLEPSTNWSRKRTTRVAFWEGWNAPGFGARFSRGSGYGRTPARTPGSSARVWTVSASRLRAPRARSQASFLPDRVALGPLPRCSPPCTALRGFSGLENTADPASHEETSGCTRAIVHLHSRLTFSLAADPSPTHAIARVQPNSPLWHALQRALLRSMSAAPFCEPKEVSRIGARRESKQRLFPDVRDQKAQAVPRDCQGWKCRLPLLPCSLSPFPVNP